MNASHIIATLNLIGKVYASILDDASKSYVIPGAIASVKASRAIFDRNNPPNESRTWGYTIHHDKPLRFEPVEVPNSIKMQVDVFCDVQWAGEETPIRQDIKIRIWCNHDQTIYDAARDSEAILQELSKADRNYYGRVVSRLHFDKANLTGKKTHSYHPQYHLQYGGIPENYELCWHPKKVNVPRLCYHPLELFLTCQIVAANFFPEIYKREIREKFEWRQELIRYQNLLLKNYYQNCLSIITRNDSLLDELGM